jgi:hypothetical protein
MKIAYFDCPTGISGNMVLAALIDAGLSVNYLKKELKKLKTKGYALELSEVSKAGFRAKHLHIYIAGKEGRRTIRDIYYVIDGSSLKKSVKTLGRKIFERLYIAESKAHGTKRAHLHEAGATDAIIDIVGTAIGLDKLGIREVYCSPLPYGYGPIKSAHGTLPNPAPATIELLKGVATYKKNIKGELVTPTGAAIITSITKSFIDMPKLKLERTGLGAGTHDFRESNILRLFIGETQVNYGNDLVLEIKTNIDNMNPELYDHVISTLIKSGALDAYITPVRMKKKRPGVELTVLSDPAKKEKILNEIFNETTTLGVRTCLVKREKLERTTKKVSTRYGRVLVKIGKIGSSIKNISPEYEDCARISKRKGVPLKAVYDAARSAASVYRFNP